MSSRSDIFLVVVGARRSQKKEDNFLVVVVIVVGARRCHTAYLVFSLLLSCATVSIVVMG